MRSAATIKRENKDALIGYSGVRPGKIGEESDLALL